MTATTMPHVELTKEHVDAMIGSIQGVDHRDRFGSSTVYHNPTGTSPLTVPTIVIDDEPAVLGKATAVASFYRLGLPKYGLPEGSLILRVDYACDCKTGHDAPCGYAFCWGTWAASAVSA